MLHKMIVMCTEGQRDERMGSKGLGRLDLFIDATKNQEKKRGDKDKQQNKRTEICQ